MTIGRRPPAGGPGAACQLDASRPRAAAEVRTRRFTSTSRLGNVHLCVRGGPQPVSADSHAKDASARASCPQAAHAVLFLCPTWYL